MGNHHALLQCQHPNCQAAGLAESPLLPGGPAQNPLVRGASGLFWGSESPSTHTAWMRLLFQLWSARQQLAVCLSCLLSPTAGSCSWFRLDVRLWGWGSCKDLTSFLSTALGQASGEMRMWVCGLSAP